MIMLEVSEALRRASTGHTFRETGDLKSVVAAVVHRSGTVGYRRGQARRAVGPARRYAC